MRLHQADTAEAEHTRKPSLLLDPISFACYRTTGIKKPMNFSNKSRSPCKVSMDIGIICINCMKTVKASLAAEHSLHCSQVQTEVKLMDQCSLIQQADYKIRRLKLSLDKLRTDTELAEGDRYYMELLTMYFGDVLKVKDFTRMDIVKCREVVMNAGSLIKGFKGSDAMMIYLERFFVVCKEKYSQMLSYYKEIADSSLGRMKSKEELKQIVDRKTEQFRSTLAESRDSVFSDRRSKVYSPMQIRRQNLRLQEVVSDSGVNEYALLHRRSKQSDMERRTITSNMAGEDNIREVDEVLALETRKRVQRENLKRYFYTIISNAKRVLGPRHLGYYVSSALLFNEIVQAKKSVDEWADFVLRELNNNPTKWIEEKKLAKLMSLYLSLF